MEKYRLPENTLGFHCLVISGDVVRLIRSNTDRLDQMFSIDLTDTMITIPNNPNGKIDIPDMRFTLFGSRRDFFQPTRLASTTTNGFKLPKNPTGYKEISVFKDSINVYHCYGFVCTICHATNDFNNARYIGIRAKELHGGVEYGSILWTDGYLKP